MSMTAIEPASDGEAWAELIYQAVRFANWAAGQGICPAAGEPAAAPEDFLMAFSDSTGFDDWEGLDTGARSRLTLAEETARAAVAAKEKAEARLNPTAFAIELGAKLAAAESTIASLQSQVEAMRGALEPFARADRALGDRPGSDATFRLETDTGYREISREAFRRARSTLAAVEKETGECSNS